MKHNNPIRITTLYCLLVICTALALIAAAPLQESDPPGAISVELLAILSGGLLSLLFSYIPGLSTWYERIDANQRRFVMLGMLVLVAAGVYAAGCAGLNGRFGLPDVACDSKGAEEVVTAFVYALIANQAVHRLSPDKERENYKLNKTNGTIENVK